MLFHCPACGHRMTQIKRDIQAEQDALMEEWAERDHKGDPPPDPDESEHWACTNAECGLSATPEEVAAGAGIYFHVHHPLGDYTSKPGDSWAVSWVE